MIKIYCIVSGKSGKFKIPKISYIFQKTLGISVVCSKGGNEYQKTFKGKETIN